MARLGPVLLLLAAALLGCGGGSSRLPAQLQSPASGAPIFTRDEAAQHGAWTILVYLDADNDLESYGVSNFNQMELVGSTKQVRIVVQIDRAPGQDATSGDWTDTRRYLVTQDQNTSEMNSIRLDDPPLGELDMADWHTLADFVAWGEREFPADHYCLVIWDHGTGWQVRAEAAAPEYKYVVADTTNSSEMNVEDIPRALAGSKIDIVAFDACLMQQLEVAYELKDSANYMVGSPAPEPSPGYLYSAWLARIGAGASPADVCRLIVEEYAAAYPPGHRGITQSAVDLAKVGAAASAASRLAGTLIDARYANSAGLVSARESALNYSTCSGGTQRYSLDLLDYASKCAAAVGPPADQAYADLAQALHDALVAEAHNPDTPNSCGLAIYAPGPASYDRRYSQLRLASDTLWDEWLQSQPR